MQRTIKITLSILAGLITIAILAYLIRQTHARRATAAEWATPPTIIPSLAPTNRLEIIPLYEEASDGDGWIEGHGVAYLIRTDSATILLDIGNNPENSPIAPFAQNMQALGIAWEEIDRIVISHSHPDHVGGLDAWLHNTIHFGKLPGGVGDRLVFIPQKMNYPGGIHATIPTLPGPDVATTGAIPYAESFPLSLFRPKGYEQALVIHVAGQGLVLVTGCGHPGLEKLVERAEFLYGQTVTGVVGGLHYEGARAEEVEAPIHFLELRQPRLVAISPHDSSPLALAAFQAAFGDRYRTLRVGETIQFP